MLAYFCRCMCLASASLSFVGTSGVPRRRHTGSKRNVAPRMQARTAELPCLVTESYPQDMLELLSHFLHFLTHTPDVPASLRHEVENCAPFRARSRLRLLGPLLPPGSLTFRVFRPEGTEACCTCRRRHHASFRPRPVFLGHRQRPCASALRAAPFDVCSAFSWLVCAPCQTAYHNEHSHPHQAQPPGTLLTSSAPPLPHELLPLPCLLPWLVRLALSEQPFCSLLSPAAMLPCRC